MSDSAIRRGVQGGCVNNGSSRGRRPAAFDPHVRDDGFLNDAHYGVAGEVEQSTGQEPSAVADGVLGQDGPGILVHHSDVDTQRVW